MAIACKFCIASKGLRGSDIGSLPQTEEELADHIEREHHLLVVRDGETRGQALRRAIDNPETCFTCRESYLDQLANL